GYRGSQFGYRLSTNGPKEIFYYKMWQNIRYGKKVYIEKAWHSPCQLFVTG
ncbi:unnamed protein product, partial [marine sediment metagenome]